MIFAVSLEGFVDSFYKIYFVSVIFLEGFYTVILVDEKSWFLELQSTIKLGIETGLLLADGTIYGIILIFVISEFRGAEDTNLMITTEVEQIFRYLSAMETSFDMLLHTLIVIIKGFRSK